MIRWWILLCSLSSIVAHAQHPFYLRIFEEGKLAMSQGDWRRAAVDFEIAAFGFLEKDALLAEAYVYLVLVHHELEQADLKAEFLRDANQVLDVIEGKPAAIGQEEWAQFEVLSGRKAPPLPPLPTDEKGLQGYLERYPESTEAWQSLIQMQMTSSRPAKTRRTVDQALEAFPGNSEILNLALWFSITQNGEEGAESLANKLMIVAPSSGLANEYLGGVAAEAGNWEKAKVFFSAVSTPSLPQTEGYLQQLREASRTGSQENLPGKEENGAEEAQAVEAASEEHIEKSTNPEENASETEEEAPVTQMDPEVLADTLQNKIQADLDLKVATLERTARSNRGDPEYRFQLVDAYIEQGDLKKAKKELAKLAKKHSRNPRYAEAYAHFQYAQGSYQTNIVNLAGFEDVTGGIAYYLGMSYFQLGQLEDASRILTKLNPEEFVIPSLVQRQEDGSKEPTETLDKLANMNRDQAVAWLRSQSDLGNWSGMQDFLEAIDAKFPADPEFRFYKGRALLGIKAYEEAMPIFIELVSEGYVDNEVFYHAGVAAWNRGKFSVGQYLFERAKANNSMYSKEINEMLSKQSRNN